jgi:hypothetical protein
MTTPQLIRVLSGKKPNNSGAIRDEPSEPLGLPSAMRHVDEPLGLESFDLEALDRLEAERLMSSRSGRMELWVKDNRKDYTHSNTL